MGFVGKTGALLGVLFDNTGKSSEGDKNHVSIKNGSGTLIKKTHVGSGFMTGASEYIREIEDYPSFLCSCFFVASHFKPHKRDLMNNMSHKFPTLIFNF